MKNILYNGKQLKDAQKQQKKDKKPGLLKFGIEAFINQIPRVDMDIKRSAAGNKK